MTEESIALICITVFHCVLILSVVAVVALVNRRSGLQRRKPKRQRDWRVVGYGGAGWHLTRCATCGKGRHRMTDLDDARHEYHDALANLHGADLVREALKNTDEYLAEGRKRTDALVAESIARRARLARVLANIARPGPIDDEPEPDYEAEWEMRHDPEAEMDAREDAYENGLY